MVDPALGRLPILYELMRTRHNITRKTPEGKKGQLHAGADPWVCLLYMRFGLENVLKRSRDKPECE